MKNVSIIGIGKLGLCFSLTLEKNGFNVLGVDLNKEYVETINQKKLESTEPGVTELLKKSKNFVASTELAGAVNHSDVLFVIVATPSLPSGRYDHTQVDSVIQKLTEIGRQESCKHFIVCCTVMPGYCDSIKEKLNELNYSVSYNPEFIAQGTILRDQANPDMVLIGEANKEVGDIIQSIYEAHTENKPKFARMTPLEAEIAKISLNCFLTTKIAYANMVGDIVKKSGGDPNVVLQAIGSDSRIGNKYLKYGYGFGGPCCLYNQLVQTDKGLKKIGKIQIGDKVLTHKGQYRKVTKTYKRQYKGILFKFKTNGFANNFQEYTIKLTPGHPVYTTKGFIPIEEIYEQTTENSSDTPMQKKMFFLPKPTISDDGINTLITNITMISEEQYSGNVYNLEVEEDESYALESCVVHNCFPRDNKSLGIYAEDLGMPAKISDATDLSNKLHLEEQVKFFEKENLDKTKMVIFDTVTYKPESDLLVESQQLAFAVLLAEKGYKVLIRERESVIKQLKKQYQDLFLYEVRNG